VPSSHELYQEACRYIPGGVNSPVRAFRAVGGEPVFLTRAAGPHVWVRRRHALRRLRRLVGAGDPRPCRSASHSRRANGGGRRLSFGAPTPIETELARLVCQLVPSIELVRMVSSGTEATMSAIRLARGYTGRDKIVKFEGCYHGHSDSLLMRRVPARSRSRADLAGRASGTGRRTR